MVFPGSIRPPLEACSNNVSTRGQIQARHRTSRQQQQREQQSSSSRVPLRQQSIQGAGAHRLSLISNAAMLAGLQPTAAESATATRLDLVRACVAVWFARGGSVWHGGLRSHARWLATGTLAWPMHACIRRRDETGLNTPPP